MFDPTLGCGSGPDDTLLARDFPFHLLVNPEENNFLYGTVLFDTDDVTSSMSLLAANLSKVEPGLPCDVGIRFVDLIFNLDNPSATLIDNNVRRVEPRNTPTMINAPFNQLQLMGWKRAQPL